MLATTVTTRAWRLLIVLATLGLVTVLSAPARAGAQQSPPPPTAVESTYTSLAGHVCSLSVEIDVQGKAASLTLPSPSRTLIATIATSPTQTATVTNLDTGAQVDLNIPGPIQTLTTDEAVFVGPTIVVRSTDYGDNTGALLYVTGRYTFLSTRLPPFSAVGALTDICALLA